MATEPVEQEGIMGCRLRWLGKQLHMSIHMRRWAPGYVVRHVRPTCSVQVTPRIKQHAEELARERGWMSDEQREAATKTGHPWTQNPMHPNDPDCDRCGLMKGLHS